MAKRFRKVESYKIKQFIFAAIVIVIAFLAYLIWQNMEKLALYGGIIFVFVVLFFLVKYYDFLLTLKEYERAVIFTLGRVSRVGGPGWALLIPIIESGKIVDLRTSTIDIPPQEVITLDKVRLTIDAVIYLFVNKDKDSVINSVIEIDDYKRGAELYVKASVRDIAGSMTLSEVISNIEKLNTDIKSKLTQIAASWGVSVEAVEITNVIIPTTVIEAMHFQKAAEQKKLAQMERAKGAQFEIDALRTAADQLTDKSLAFYYIKALEKIADGRSTKIIFPIEISKLAESIGTTIGAAAGVGKKSTDETIGTYAEMLKDYLDSAKKKKNKK